MTNKTSQKSSSDKPEGSNSMWGGRFDRGPAEIMEAINASIDFDQRLYRQDIHGSKAHAHMLSQVGVISPQDNQLIQDGLDQVEQEIANGDFTFRRELEDIHMNVEGRLREIAGEPAGRLHTGRSRNDQVALDVRLWVRDMIDVLDGKLTALALALIEQAEKEAATPMPGYTHLQAAQPVTFGHHMMAYVEMVRRDMSRFADCRKRLNESPLGAAALAGTGFPIDRHMTAETLGFDGPMRNSIDAVADRDYALEYLSAGSILAMHLSRLAEEIVIWASAPFSFVKLSDAFSTGSSIMPQKRNPDAAELVRGKAGRLIGAFVQVFTVMKGLPLTYGKDMQEDKEGLFDATDNLFLCVDAMTGMVNDLECIPENLMAATTRGHITATDLADWLVRELNMPFRNAHHVTGSLVKLADTHGCSLAELDLAQMQSVEPAITDGIYEVLSVQASVSSRKSFGGTAPERVLEAAAEARASLV